MSICRKLAFFTTSNGEDFWKDLHSTFIPSQFTVQLGSSIRMELGMLGWIIESDHPMSVLVTTACGDLLRLPFWLCLISRIASMSFELNPYGESQ